MTNPRSDPAKCCSLADAAQQIEDKTLTATQLLAWTVKRLRATEPVVHAYQYLDLEGARCLAEAADQQIAARGPKSPLHGIPIGIKDLLNVAGMPTTAGSRLFAQHEATQDAEVVANLRAAGAIILGKQYTHEFGVGVNVPPTRTPWGLDRYPGGSTVGGAVSVAVGSCLAAFGTDGGGSIRKPAAINGLVGFKPTLDAIGTAGIFPSIASVDHVGWIVKTVTDARLIWDTLTRSNRPTRLDASPSTLRLGCFRSAFEGVDPAIEAVVRNTLVKIQTLGGRIEWLDAPPGFDEATRIHGILVGYELYQRHRQWMQESPQAYDPKTLHCLQAGKSITQAMVSEAREKRVLLTQAMEEIFRTAGIHALCSPTVPIPSEPIATMDAEKTLANYIRLTVPFNLTGQPAISIPCGLAADTGMPVGLQLAAPRHAEAQLFHAASRIEAMGVWSHPKPAALKALD